MPGRGERERDILLLYWERGYPIRDIVRFIAASGRLEGEAALVAASIIQYLGSKNKTSTKRAKKLKPEPAPYRLPPRGKLRRTTAYTASHDACLSVARAFIDEVKATRDPTTGSNISAKVACSLAAERTAWFINVESPESLRVLISNREKALRRDPKALASFRSGTIPEGQDRAESLRAALDERLQAYLMERGAQGGAGD